MSTQEILLQKEFHSKILTADNILLADLNPEEVFLSMFSKYFTLKEANQLLPIIKPIVQSILEKGQSLRAGIADNPGFLDSLQSIQIQKEMTQLMRDLEGKGCFFKDWNFEIGLVDFPAMVDGKEALLCWRSDEGEILWYHSLDDGFSGRRPIPEYWLLDMGNFKG